MSTSTLNISLPDSMRQFVEEKISKGGYGTISEYVRELIRKDQSSEQARFDVLIAEAYASGESSLLTKADIEEARKIVKARIAKRNRSK
ncbi:MAG: type II toxin-antitoxin system ParD family antitoxin [Acidobacteria bacterium]|nr:MAG: type II toxin-antitoxin system ParD family antitoxin [Acidobacteriota bacterium]